METFTDPYTKKQYGYNIFSDGSISISVDEEYDGIDLNTMIYLDNYLATILLNYHNEVNILSDISLSMKNNMIHVYNIKQVDECKKIISNLNDIGIKTYHKYVQFLIDNCRTDVANFFDGLVLETNRLQCLMSIMKLVEGTINIYHDNIIYCRIKNGNIEILFDKYLKKYKKYDKLICPNKEILALMFSDPHFPSRYEETKDIKFFHDKLYEWTKDIIINYKKK